MNYQLLINLILRYEKELESSQQPYQLQGTNAVMSQQSFHPQQEPCRKYFQLLRRP